MIMKNTEAFSPQFISVRPLVRYVDEKVAVIETHVVLAAQDAVKEPKKTRKRAPLITLYIRMVGPGGRDYQHRTVLKTKQNMGVARFDMMDPDRWWPAGLGDQSLYRLTFAMLVKDEVVDTWQCTIGLTSVRSAGLGGMDTDPLPAPQEPSDSLAEWLGSTTQGHAMLLINGREYPVHSIIPVNPHDENRVLPVGGDSLLLVNNHFGFDLLYEAADRAGVLLVQSIPLAGNDPPAWDVHTEVDRLVRHPSLAGWYVAEESPIGDRIASEVHQLDPTRRVFRHLPPGVSAAGL
jgi:hypothetical protein